MWSYLIIDPFLILIYYYLFEDKHNKNKVHINPIDWKQKINCLIIAILGAGIDKNIT